MIWVTRKLPITTDLLEFQGKNNILLRCMFQFIVRDIPEH